MLMLGLSAKPEQYLR